MKINQLYTRVLFFGLILIHMSCGKDLPIITPEPLYSIEKVTVFDKEVHLIQGIINDSLRLSNKNRYLIDGKLVVNNQGILSIEAGTIIYAKPNAMSYLLIDRGGKINAQGTSQAPIIFTSLNDINASATYGDWGGIHINGQAIINERSSSLTLEIGKYGRLESEENEDNSGVLSYARVEYAGEKIGITEGALNLNGLGSKTQIDHIQTYFSNGNGIRIRGGTVNVSHIMSTQTKGIGIRWDNGWNGNGQFIVANFSAPMTDTVTLLVGASSTVGNLPSSSPRLSNISLIGSKNIVSRGLRLGEGTHGMIYNMIIQKSDRAIRADNSFNEIIARKLFVKHSLLFDNLVNYFENVTSVAGILADPEFKNTYVPIPMQGYIGSTTSMAFDPKQIDDMFEPATYIGAVENSQNNWTLNWTKQ